MRLGVTGPRPQNFGEVSYFRVHALAKAALLELKPTKVYTGMALGWDQIIAVHCIEMKIPFVACIPFQGQESKWSRVDQEVYTNILKHAAEKYEIACPPTSEWARQEAFQMRNEFIVDGTELLLALWDGSPGGTANCVRYARETRAKVENVWSLLAEGVF